MNINIINTSIPFKWRWERSIPITHKFEWDDNRLIKCIPINNNIICVYIAHFNELYKYNIINKTWNHWLSLPPNISNINEVHFDSMTNYLYLWSIKRTNVWPQTYRKYITIKANINDESNKIDIKEQDAPFDTDIEKLLYFNNKLNLFCKPGANNKDLHVVYDKNVKSSIFKDDDTVTKYR